jgi:3-oxoacyl-[acyl-carrier protein] reductase
MKRALVTGGSGAIGMAICQRLAASGCHVYVHAHTNVEGARHVVSQIMTQGNHAEVITFDVTDRLKTESELASLMADGPIQILINNAGVRHDAVMPAMKANQWADVIDVSLNGFFNVTQPLLLPMIGTRWGRIVNISSVAGLVGNRGQVNYAAAKAGLHGATKSLALELASRGITVNAVAPGIIASPMTQGLFTQETINHLVPMKRVGRPEDVAALVNFLASDEAGYISGQIISVNGAMI